MIQEKHPENYWIIAASKDHVKAGIALGIAQACHGKASPLRRMKKGDFVIFYSGKQTLGKPEKCQQFTAIGQLTNDDVYQVQVSEDFCPSRRSVTFLPSADVSILPLIDKLDFIENKKSWGYPFRFGFFKISQRDFALISSQMLQSDYA